MISPDTITRLATEPIPGDKRAGEDARYDPSFESLEAEIAKLEALSGGEVDWGVVDRVASDILATRSKHLLVAARLVRAWHQRHGLGGLHAGLRLLHGLCSNFWEDAYPEVTRLRARSSALKWLSDGLVPLITGGDAAELGRCREAMTELLGLIQPRFSDGDCGLGGLRRALDDAANNAAADAAAAPADTATNDAPPAESSTPVSAAAPRTAPAGRSGPIASRDEALKRLREIAEWFQRNDPHSPVGFLAQRAVNLGNMGFQEAFADLLQNNASAQSELWQILGLKPPG